MLPPPPSTYSPTHPLSARNMHSHTYTHTCIHTLIQWFLKYQSLKDDSPAWVILRHYKNTIILTNYINSQNYLWYTSSFFTTAYFFYMSKKLITVVWINHIQNYSSIKLRLHFKYEDIWLDSQTSLLRTFKGKNVFEIVTVSNSFSVYI